ncbi:class I SAM-dependent methyltransferase [Vreelandella arctica]|uniref:class I SAM-dependent methyltransferase n=1 Tax=Vreelandella arctica TaxID=3126499 RepID=UPI00300E51A9
MGKKRKQRKSLKLSPNKQRASEVVANTPTASAKLTQIRTYWLFGEWQRMAAISEESLVSDNDRAAIALLVCSAHQQMNDPDATRHWARLAIQWGITPNKVARLLAAGVHNAFGRIAILREDTAGISKHFTASTQLAQMQDTDTGTVARAKAAQEAKTLNTALPASLLNSTAPDNAQYVADGFYRAFEDKFRGSREKIKRRVSVYLPFVRPIAKRHPGVKALDLGCGRGEWLEVLKEAGIDSDGVDQDMGMLNGCQALGLTVKHGDALEYLREQPNASRISVSLIHVVEHIPFDMLRTLVAEAKRVLVSDGILIMETPNPENYTVGSCTFYMDPTHRNPLPPPLLAFVPEYYGFERTKVLRLQEGSETQEKPQFDVEDFLTGISPDYAVVAQVARPVTQGGAEEEGTWEKEYGISYFLMSKRNAPPQHQDE